MTRLICASAILSLVGLAAPAAAQNNTDVGIGYQFQRISAEGESLNFPAGFNVDVAGKILPNLSLVGQVDWSRKSASASAFGITAEGSVNLTTFGGGIRWSSTTNPNITPFVQGLVGATHGSGSASIAGEELINASGTDAMIQVGGGVAFPSSKRIGAVAQFDYRRVFEEGGGGNLVRFVFGIRIKVG